MIMLMKSKKKKREKEDNRVQADNGIGATGASKLCGALKVNTTLTQVNLSGFHKIMKRIKENWNYVFEKRSGNGIADEGALMVSEVLKVNSTLSILDLGRVFNDGNECIF